MNLCPYCKTRPLCPVRSGRPKKTCGADECQKEHHKVINLKQETRFIDARKAKGMCIKRRCAKPAAAGNTMCEACRDANKKYQYRWRRRDVKGKRTPLERWLEDPMNRLLTGNWRSR